MSPCFSLSLSDSLSPSLSLSLSPLSFSLIFFLFLFFVSLFYYVFSLSFCVVISLCRGLCLLGWPSAGKSSMNIGILLLQQMGLPLCAEELFDSARCRGDELRCPTENSAHAHWGPLNLWRLFALLCWTGGLWCRRMLPEGDAHRPATLAADGCSTQSWSPAHRLHTCSRGGCAFSPG